MFRQLAIAALLFAGCVRVLCAETTSAEWNYWQPWEPCAIAVGNERDGFLDSVPGRRALTSPEGEGRELIMPYLSKVPEENRHLLIFTRLTDAGRRATLLESTDECETWRAVPMEGDLGMAWGMACVGNGVVVACDGAVRSEDNGRTWTREGLYQHVKTARFPSMICGWDPPLVVKGSGGRHLIGTGYYTRNYYYSEAKVNPVIRESHDAGRTWTPWRGLPEFPGVSEVTLAYNAKGEILAGLREDEIGGCPDDHYSRLSTSVSTDGGQTWAEPKVVAGNGRHHPSFAVLPDGRVVMSYVVRMGYPKTDGRHTYGIEAVVSYDDGRTWDTDHRYVLAKWTNDCVLTDSQGNRVAMPHFYGAPQNTSTHYLSESGCLITFYGTGQNRSYTDEQGNHLPHQVGAVKWMPMPREQYTTEKAAPPEPIAADEALAKLRANTGWAVSYNALTGLPDGGWVNNYADGCASVADGWLTLEHTHNRAGYYPFRGLDRLVTIYGAFGLRARLEVPEGGEDKPHRLIFYAVINNGWDRHSVELIIDRDANLVGPLGLYKLPTENGKPFLLEVWGDPRSRRLRVWVDGALVADREYTPQSMPPETPSTFYFGSGSRSVGGTIKLAFLQFGAIE